ncbi:MAG: PEP-CTERM sorting domain-containing protein [Cyanomargarita calcarea GSE-NOS-MK-12-04C]|uniref:PEP-CTERM sorting domain-containing protein n=1 Tax=Cyanomargarita calcarea GSE-NOS-MK-12-04C TaxID=2839659 RepID=A0A951QGW3_9CYAN|nr:PEP-CTERM sorting domain-containing protein [Cyanomargarita calcarea GSE-NOS-MK-12-04C]
MYTVLCKNHKQPASQTIVPEPSTLLGLVFIVGLFFASSLAGKRHSLQT